MKVPPFFVRKSAISYGYDRLPYNQKQWLQAFSSKKNLQPLLYRFQRFQFSVLARTTVYVCSTTESTIRQMPTQKEKPTSCSSPKRIAAMAML